MATARQYARKVKSNVRWTEEILAEKASAYSSRKSFELHDRNAYSAAQRRGILSKICQHMPITSTSWTYETLQTEASKYNSRSDFSSRSRSAYYTALKRGILDEICSHMTLKTRRMTDLDLANTALQFQTRAEFEKKDPSAIAIARKRGILDKICTHMKKSCGISAEEMDLLNSIKLVYPKAQKFRDNKVEIEGKPYIKGFDIDIYVPELRKGIEFDGTYWHSEEGLKKSRPWWPEEDLKSYHIIKDNYFQKKGIALIHISELEFYSDRQGTLEKCMKFLRGTENGN